MDFAWAWTLGIVFQYFTIVPMREIGKLRGIWAAIKADTLSILAFQEGLFAGMAIYQELIFAPGLPKTTATYWMMMQLSMILGFFTALPVNSWLIKKGLKRRCNRRACRGPRSRHRVRVARSHSGRSAMNIGEPRRTLTVEPAEPVPGIAPASPPPAPQKPATPLEAPACR